jgi:hypothetical protein
MSVAIIDTTGVMAMCGKAASRVFRFNTTTTYSPGCGMSSSIQSARNWVDHTRDWHWSHLHFPALTDPLPFPVPTEALFSLDQPLSLPELTTLRTCINRQQPFGAPGWQARMASLLGLVSTLRPRGRPPSFPEK